MIREIPENSCAVGNAPIDGVKTRGLKCVSNSAGSSGVCDDDDVCFVFCLCSKDPSRRTVMLEALKEGKEEEDEDEDDDYPPLPVSQGEGGTPHTATGEGEDDGTEEKTTPVSLLLMQQDIAFV